MAESEKTIAYTCPYVPGEWIAAHGLRPRRLIPLPVEGASVIPRLEGLCPYARAFINDVAASKSVDGVIVTTMCDQMRRVFDLLVRRVDMPAFLLNVPSTWQTVAAQKLYVDELKRLGRFLVQFGGHKPDKAGLTQAILDRAHGNGVPGTPHAGWQRQAESSELAGGSKTYARAIGKLALAAATHLFKMGGALRGCWRAPGHRGRPAHAAGSGPVRYCP